MSRPLRLESVTLAAYLLGTICACAELSDVDTYTRVGRGEFASLCGQKIGIRIGEQELAALKQKSRDYVPARATIGTNAYDRVGIHLKGMGSFRALDQKPALVIKFNEYNKAQNLRGISKIALNNCIQDPSCLAETIANQCFRMAGLPAPAAEPVTVELNGRDLGTYTLVEAINKPFLRRVFKHDEGNLYEGNALDIDGDLEQDNGEDISREICKR